MTEDRRQFSFDDVTYPNAPGHRGVDTSIEAAEHIEPHVGRLQKMALEAITAHGAEGLTVLEVCARTNVDRIAMQPRITELSKLKLIHKSPLRRVNPSGVKAIVWRAGPPPPPAAD